MGLVKSQAPDAGCRTQNPVMIQQLSMNQTKKIFACGLGGSFLII